MFLKSKGFLRNAGHWKKHGFETFSGFEKFEKRDNVFENLRALWKKCSIAHTQGRSCMERISFASSKSVANFQIRVRHLLTFCATGRIGLALCLLCFAWRLGRLP